MQQWNTNFAWDVSASGHVWLGEGEATVVDVVRGDLTAEAVGHRPPWLVAKPAPPSADVVRCFPLRDNPALYKEFASLDPTPEAIAAFADRWGMLTAGTTTVKPIQGGGLPGDLGSRGSLRVESHAFWCHAVQEMRNAIVLWNLVGAGVDGGTEPQRLREVIRIDSKARTIDYLPAHRVTLYEYDRLALSQGDRTHEMKPETVKQASETAMRALVDSLRREERHHIYPVPLVTNDVPPEILDELWEGEDLVKAAWLLLGQIVSREVGLRSELRVILRPGGEPYGLFPHPRNLLGALWLMLLGDVTRLRGARQCPVCQRWFGASLSGKRVYCPDRACRQKAYELRKKTRKLVAAGATTEEIARKLQLPPSTIELLRAKSATKEPTRRARRT